MTACFSRHRRSESLAQLTAACAAARMGHETPCVAIVESEPLDSHDTIVRPRTALPANNNRCIQIRHHHALRCSARPGLVPSRPESISIIGTCATRAIWDAVLEWRPQPYREYCKGARRRNTPLSGRLPNGRATASRCSAPRPFGLRQKHAPALSRVLSMRPGLGLA
jgi:hypothetical protein